MNKIGILGGTFNPIHNGHLYLADSAYKALELTKVLIMPSGISYLKSNDHILPKDIRANMVKYAIEDYPYFEFCDVEINRSGNTYTYETLLELNKIYPHDSLYFIVGADTLFGIENWVNPQQIFDNCIIAVMNRNDSSSSDIIEKSNELILKYNAKIELIDVEKYDVSSSEIRKLFSTNDKDVVRNLLPQKVFDYIIDNKLY